MDRYFGTRRRCGAQECAAGREGTMAIEWAARGGGSDNSGRRGSGMWGEDILAATSHACHAHFIMHVGCMWAWAEARDRHVASA